MLRAEKKLRRLTSDLKHRDHQEGALFCLIQAVPCILHLENCVGLKIFTMILLEGLSNAKKGRIYFETRFEGSCITKFFERVEYLVNAKIIGTEDNLSEWNRPRSPNGKRLVQ